MRNNSNQEHDNANLHPPNPESIEQLVEQIIYSVSVRRLSDWECVLHVYLFLDEFFEEIMDLHPLLIFVWLISSPMRDPHYMIRWVLSYCDIIPDLFLSLKFTLTTSVIIYCWIHCVLLMSQTTHIELKPKDSETEAAME